jgi:hypothetical protein
MYVAILFTVTYSANGSLLVVGLLFFGVYGALFNVMSRSVALYFLWGR